MTEELLKETKGRGWGEWSFVICHIGLFADVSQRISFIECLWLVGVLNCFGMVTGLLGQIGTRYVVYTLKKYKMRITTETHFGQVRVSVCLGRKQNWILDTGWHS
jgi:hypothetical protein